MKHRWHRGWTWLIVVLIVALASWPQASVNADDTELLGLVSYETMRPHIDALTQIEAFSGWRNAGTGGEQAALDYVENTLAGYQNLATLGMEMERQGFSIYSTMETWESTLSLTIDGAEVEIAADVPKGSRDFAELLLRFDTDGQINDTDPNPVTVEGGIQTIVDADDLVRVIGTGTLPDSIVFVNYALLDTHVTSSEAVISVFQALVAAQPAAIVLVTQFSEINGDSRGTGAGDIGLLSSLVPGQLPPFLYARFEDFAEAGITTWEDLQAVSASRVTVDVDVLNPGQSGNLVATIPGKDRSRTMIVGANIDSPAGPGALDNASGVASLLEIARVLDESNTQPETDLVLVWFGAEEVGFYGSSYFVSTHQDLLDQTIAMLNIDSLTAPVGQVSPVIELVTWSYARIGLPEMRWLTLTQKLADEQGIRARIRDIPTVSSDNTAFNAYDVPNLNLVYQDLLNMVTTGGIEYVGNLHSPYDTLEQVDAQATTLVEMTRLALGASLAAMQTEQRFSPSKIPNKQAVFIASHTEAATMVTTQIAEFGMTFSGVGFDVDLIPYGTSFTAETLAEADLVVVFPNYDYADPVFGAGDSDNLWTEAERDALVSYVEAGGFLVVVNAGRRINYDNVAGDVNEDRFALNMIAEPFGISFIEGTSDFRDYNLLADSPLFDNVDYLDLGNETAVRFTYTNGAPLVGTSADDPLMVGMQHGQNRGLVLVVGDLGVLNARIFTPGEGAYRNPNLPFWMNLSNMVTRRADAE